jgi:hypothetical protein
LSITLKLGESVEGSLVDATEDGLRVAKSGKTTRVEKSDVSLVFASRLKPFPDLVLNEFPTEVLNVFDPRIWPFLFKVGDHTKVLVYDATQPEDNSVTECPKPKH